MSKDVIGLIEIHPPLQNVADKACCRFHFCFGNIGNRARLARMFDHNEENTNLELCSNFSLDLPLLAIGFA